ncbi:flagellar FlbD family protein [Priestia sp. SB1]|uniref:Flagellar FlbD family protein n=1 Tax=Priestia aryabhattai TaxID=412384 RepID=A0AAX6NE52_PRIAR|nr:flagellar FlbD family protein [Priestia aryabhattai]MDU9693785.1 flagellar FlbD family protein [Priestia aryabhattai]
MIYLTKIDEEKTKFSINHRNILTVEKSIGGKSNVHTDNGKVFTVAETEEEINEKIISYEATIIERAIKKALEEIKQFN